MKPCSGSCDVAVAVAYIAATAAYRKYTKARSNEARSNRVVKIVKPGRNFENPSDASYKSKLCYLLYRKTPKGGNIDG